MRKHRVLSHGLPSVTRSIADAIVLKQGDLFLIADPDGQLPGTTTHGLGLYYHDCRYLRTYELRLNGEPLVPLGVNVAGGDRGSIQLTNAELQRRDHRQELPRDTLDIEWDRTLDGGALELADAFTLRNWAHRAVDLTLDFSFDACFEDVFDVRGLLDERLGKADAPEWEKGVLRFVYHGKDKLTRSLTVRLPPEFDPSGHTGASARFRLESREERRFAIHLQVREWEQDSERQAPRSGSSTSQPLPAEDLSRLPAARTCTSDSIVLDDVLQRGFTDLAILQSTIRGRSFIAAGIPWFATLFGRDSLIAALQLLPFAPSIARDTLHLLAGFQADQVDHWRDAAPGKILHELRVGEMASVGAIPHNPYYGTVDATPLFLLVLARYVDWTGDLELFDELRDNVRRALEWIDRYGDADGDGYVEYQSASKHGLVNQGWKDSGDAIVDENGNIATPPIALVEVQAYVYAAKLALADLFSRRDDETTAERLRREARELQRRFNRDFWVESLGCYAMALAAGKEPLRVVSSNAGHALCCGIAEPDKASRVAQRLMEKDMFSGWGVRTLSEQCQGYNPIGYHLGTVWPHDNGLVGAGLVRYGFAAEARRIFDGITAAATHFEHRRLPELWTGFSRERYETPIRYPVACHPQAWAAGSLPFLLQHLLGLQPHALDHRLGIVRPTLPGLARWVELRGIRVGGATVDLRFEGGDSQQAPRVEVLELRGELDLEVESAPRIAQNLQRRVG